MILDLYCYERTFMSDNNFTLEGIQKAADQRFGKLVVDDAVFNSPVRIDKASRERVYELVEELSQEEESGEAEEFSEDLLPTFIEFLTLVGDAKAKTLVKNIGDDLGVLILLFEAYNEAVGLGESSASSE